MQKTDLIAELKRTKDIPGIKKLKVERAQVEKTQEQNLMSEINKAFSVTNFVDQVSIFIFFSETHYNAKYVWLFNSSIIAEFLCENLYVCDFPIFLYILYLLFI